MTNGDGVKVPVGHFSYLISLWLNHAENCVIITLNIYMILQGGAALSTQNQRKLDNSIKEKTSDELLEEIAVNKRKLKRSFVFAFVALIALIALGIAWFMSNSKVTSTGTSVSAQDDRLFELASVGKRQTAEEDYLKDESKKSILSAGTEKTYASYIENGTEVQKEQTYYVGTGSLAWYLDSQESILPGANGKLEFYIIPKKDNVKSVTVSFDINAYVYTDEGNTDKRVVKSEDTTLQNLIQGHILFFQQLDDVHGYQKWLKADESFVIEAPENGSFKKNVPYKVTIYWIWPQYFRNYVYTQKSTQGDLFTDAASQTSDSDYARINTFINSQRTIEKSKNKLFYDESSEVQVGSDINKNMAQDTLEQCSNYYNKADEYIGTNAKYIYVGIKAN